MDLKSLWVSYGIGIIALYSLYFAIRNEPGITVETGAGMLLGVTFFVLGITVYEGVKRALTSANLIGGKDHG